MFDFGLFYTQKQKIDPGLRMRRAVLSTWNQDQWSQLQRGTTYD